LAAERDPADHLAVPDDEDGPAVGAARGDEPDVPRADELRRQLRALLGRGDGRAEVVAAAGRPDPRLRRSEDDRADRDARAGLLAPAGGRAALVRRAGREAVRVAGPALEVGRAVRRLLLLPDDVRAEQMPEGCGAVADIERDNRALVVGPEPADRNGLVRRE